MPPWRGVGQEHRDLRVLDPFRSAGVLPLHPDRLGALLHIPGLIDHQHRTRMTKMINDVAAQVIPHRVGVPPRPRQQMLQPIRSGLPAVLGDRPTVLPVQTRQQPQHQRRGVPARLVPGETRPDPVHHLTETIPPTSTAYPVRRGHRRIVRGPHNSG